MRNILKFFSFILILCIFIFVFNYLLLRYFYPIENQLQDAGIVFIQDIEIEKAEDLQKEKDTLLKSWLDKLGKTDSLEVVSLSDVFPYQVYNERLAELQVNIDQGIVAVLKKRKDKIYSEEDILAQALVISNDGWVVLPELDYKGGLEFLGGDGTPLEVESIIDDSSISMRFVKLKANNLSVLKFANSDYLMNGEFVINIDSLGNTYVGNIVDKYNYNTEHLSLDFLAKRILVDFHADKLVSASPIFNFNGEVIAVISNEMMNSKVRAIPIKYLTLHLAEIYENSLSNYDSNIYYKDLAQSLQVVQGQNKGALLEQAVVLYADLEKTQMVNLYVGDIILKVDEQELNKTNSLNEVLHQYKKGTNLQFTILRNGKELMLDIVL